MDQQKHLTFADIWSADICGNSNSVLDQPETKEVISGAVGKPSTMEVNAIDVSSVISTNKNEFKCKHALSGHIDANLASWNIERF